MEDPHRQTSPHGAFRARAAQEAAQEGLDSEGEGDGGNGWEGGSCPRGPSQSQSRSWGQTGQDTRQREAEQAEQQRGLDGSQPGRSGGGADSLQEQRAVLVLQLAAPIPPCGFAQRKVRKPSRPALPRLPPSRRR
eukprot:4284202-Pyramimonas_sp.AAC.1